MRPRAADQVALPMEATRDPAERKRAHCGVGVDQGANVIDVFPPASVGVNLPFWWFPRKLRLMWLEPLESANVPPVPCGVLGECSDAPGAEQCNRVVRSRASGVEAGDLALKGERGIEQQLAAGPREVYCLTGGDDASNSRVEAPEMISVPVPDTVALRSSVPDAASILPVLTIAGATALGPSAGLLEQAGVGDERSRVGADLRYRCCRRYSRFSQPRWKARPCRWRPRRRW